MKRIHAQSGLSLIELMVSVAIGLILMTGVVSIVTDASRTHRELAKVGRQIENGRYSIGLLQREIEHAGYFGEFYLLADPPSSAPDPCSTAVANIEAALPVHIQGYDSPSGNPPPTCLSDADHVDGTDILVIRRVSTEPTALGSLVTGELYLQGRATTYELAVADSDNSNFDLTKLDGTTAADIHKLRVDIYFIGSNADGIPMLKKLELTESGGSLSFVERSLVPGIENLQIDYGIDRNGDGTPNDGTGGNAYETGPSDSEWADVVSTRLHLLARNLEPTLGYNDQRKYDMGLAGAFDPAEDDYRRHAYTATVRAVNASIRRE